MSVKTIEILVFESVQTLARGISVNRFVAWHSLNVHASQSDADDELNVRTLKEEGTFRTLLNSVEHLSTTILSLFLDHLCSLITPISLL